MFDNLVEVEYIQNLVIQGHSHESIATHLSVLHPGVRGLSARSVRRFCYNHNITKLSNDEIDGLVGDFIVNYGHGYGRAMMQGSIRAAFGVTTGVVSQRRVSNSLRRVAPDAYDARTRDILVRTNPIPYYAPFFGYKAHMDQNEKIGQRFGCTHVALVDGCSRMICGYASMEVKNPILIYEFVYRKALIDYGLWNQLRVDHGREFCLCIFVQDLLKRYRLLQEKAPWKQTRSTDNNVIERFWPELNSRVNYPIKRALIQISEDNDHNMADPIIKYCYSWISIYIASDAAQHLIRSWNFHRVPGSNGCVPVQNMIDTKRTVVLDQILIPTAPEAVRMYEENGGRLTRNAEFGYDPLGAIEHAYTSRQQLFFANQPSGKDLFSALVHGDYRPLQRALNFFYDLTLRFAE